MAEFKDRLKDLRLAHNMSQLQLALDLSKSASAVKAWEAGKYKPEVDVVIAMSKLFQCSVDYLLGLSEDTALDVVAGRVEESKSDMLDMPIVNGVHTRRGRSLKAPYSIRQLECYAVFLETRISEISSLVRAGSPSLPNVSKNRYIDRTLLRDQDELENVEKETKLTNEEIIVDAVLSLIMELVRVRIRLFDMKNGCYSKVKAFMTTDIAAEVIDLLGENVVRDIIGTLRNPKLKDGGIEQRRKRIIDEINELKGLTDAVAGSTMCPDTFPFEPYYSEYDTFEDILRMPPHSACKDLNWYALYNITIC